MMELIDLILNKKCRHAAKLAGDAMNISGSVHMGHMSKAKASELIAAMIKSVDEVDVSQRTNVVTALTKLNTNLSSL